MSDTAKPPPVTLHDAIRTVEEMTANYAGVVRDVVVGSGDDPAEIDARVAAMQVVIDEAKMTIDPAYWLVTVGQSKEMITFPPEVEAMINAAQG